MDQTELINNILKETSNLQDIQFLQGQIAEFLGSKTREDMINAYKYLKGEHDILERKREAIGANGKKAELKNVPNNKIVDNLYLKMVDQKTNYLFSKQLVLQSDNEQYLEVLKTIFNKRFHKLLKKIGTNAINYGIAWVYVYIEEQDIKFKSFKPYEILPFWADEDHTILDMVVRIYNIEKYDSSNKKTIITKVEAYTKERIDYYTLDGYRLVLDESKPYITINGTELLINQIPIIAFKFNDMEQPLLNRVKTLQDALNTLRSDFMNNMQEDARSTILILKDYGGTDLSEFRHNLIEYGIVKYTTSIDGKGGIDTLQVEVNASNYDTIINMMKRAIIENCRGYDAKDERLGNNPNQLNIRSMYSDIDLDANGLELEFQASLEQLMVFINAFLLILQKGNFENERVNFIFNKDQLLNESQVITDLVNSVGILSNETIVANHPYIEDPILELEKIKNEQQAYNYDDNYPSHKDNTNE